jgi:hypothetical protein
MDALLKVKIGKLSLGAQNGNKNKQKHVGQQNLSGKYHGNNKNMSSLSRTV